MKKLVALLLSGILLTAVTSSAGVIYRETFDNTSGVQNGFFTTGWTALRASNGGTPADSSANQNAFGISTTNGTPVSAGPGVNAGTNGVGTATGLPFETGGTYYSFNYSSEATSGVTSGMLSQISFYEGNGNTAFTFQPLVEVGSQWYISNQAFANPTVLSGGQFSTLAVQQLLNIDASTLWRTISFSTTTVFNTTTSIGSSTTSLPDGSVMAWGLYGDLSNTVGGGGNARFDDFAVSTVPEPSTYAVIVGGAACLLVFPRRRIRLSC